MPPCSWIASWPMCRPALLTWSLARAAASRFFSASESSSASTIVAQVTMLRVSSSETYMSAARKVSAWKRVERDAELLAGA